MKKSTFFGFFAIAMMFTTTLRADQVVLDDQVIDGSLCVGLDCVNGEAFGFDTLRLKENNVRINFQDTSNSASFPNSDWGLIANDSSNGGGNHFSITHTSAGWTPVRVDGSARTNALVVTGQGLGLGTAVPALNLDITDGDTPTIRLNQNGTAGYQAQQWDVGGNESNFFIRNPGTSALPLKVLPTAGSNSLVLAGNRVGMGVTNPSTGLHMETAEAGIRVVNSNDNVETRDLLTLSNQGDVSLTLVNADALTGWTVGTVTENGRTDLEIGVMGQAAALVVNQAGDLTVTGNLRSLNVSVEPPDYVFEKNYPLMPLDKLAIYIKDQKHLPRIPSANEIKKNGISHVEFQLQLLEKIEELTLYTLAQQKSLENLAAGNMVLVKKVQRLMKRVK